MRRILFAPAAALLALAMGPRAPGDVRLLEFETEEGTWMSVDVSPDGRTIAFDLLGSVYVVPITGGRARQLTQGPAFDERPKFTRDGRYIVFSSDRDGPVRLWRIPARGGPPALVPVSDTAGFSVMPESRVIIVPNDTGTVWSPVGGYGVRTTRTKFGNQTYGCTDTVPPQFLLVDRATGRQRPLAPAGNDCGGAPMPRSAFTPDGRAFITSYGGKLRRIDVSTGATTVIPFRARVRIPIRRIPIFRHPISDDSLVHARRIEHPRLSPDGRQVAFGALNHVWTMELPEGKPRRLTSLAAGEFEPVWSPDGRYVAFVTWSEIGGEEGAVYRVRSDGSSAPDRLTREPGHYSHPAYTPDGERIVVTRRSPLLHHRTVAEMDERMLTATPELLWVPADGGVARWIADLDARSVLGTGGDLVGYGTATFRSDQPGHALLFQTDYPRGRSRLTEGHLLAHPLLREASTMPDTLLRVVGPGNPVQHFPRPLGGAVYDAVPSPTAAQALVLVDYRKLYLADVSACAGAVVQARAWRTAEPVRAGQGDGACVPPEPRLITSLREGAEFPAWRADGRLFTYSFGNALYVYDLDAAERAARTDDGTPYAPRAIRIDVAIPRDRPRGTLALSNARIVTMRAGRPDGGVIERGDLVVRDRRIVAVGPSGKVAIPAEARVLDLAGKTIVPGLVDLHNHVFPTATVHRERVWQLEANLAYGVLASRDVQANLADFLTYEDLVATGALRGTRYRNTGPGIGSFTIHNAQEARDVVARYRDGYGVEFLKEYGLHYRDQRRWLVEAAAERGLNVTSHGWRRLKHVISNAVDGYAGYEHQIDTAPLYNDVLTLLAASGITLSNTNWDGFQQYYARSLTTQDSAKLAHWMPPGFLAVQWQRDLAPRPAKGGAYSFWKMDSTLVRLVAAGGRLGVGAHGDVPGLGTHLEMWAFVEGGMPPVEALRAGTLRGAEALGLDGDLGSLEVGKLADLLILDANPLESIRNSLRLHAVLFDGRLYDAKTLDEKWPELRNAPRQWWHEGN